ncbi:hypothetical protein CHS0354_006951 [Potamilus streckersoni]|uniref:Peptidase S49 domain-containing protein n=1 Tax=Potamilus streckersoni TaxID=2493646 RepID=A0AAE0WD30_9BIVA|nr:hypothetical protein CHS0354_006951 [Potamilus streckersoni]
MRIFVPVLVLVLFLSAGGLHSSYAPGEALSKQYIGLVEVNGVITDSARVNRQLEELLNNKDVAGIVLRVNSPGGTVAASQEIYEMVKDVAAGKKIYVSMADMAASGGLYISLGANKIYANPGTITGSIGVIFEGMNIRGLMEKIGVDALVYKSGEKKDIMSMYRQPTEEEAEIMQSVVNDTYQQFLTAVSQGRNMTPEEVEEIADGRIFNGRQAKDAGLVDDLKSFEGVVEDLKTDLKIPNASIIDAQDPTEEFMNYINGVLGPSIQQQALSRLRPVVNNQVEKAIKELKRKLIREGVFKEISKRRFYLKPSVKAKLKREEAEKRKIKDRRRHHARTL